MLYSLMEPGAGSELHKFDRVNLITDIYNQVYAGEKSMQDYLHYLRYFKEDKEVIIWSVIDSQIGSLNRLLQNTDYGEYFDSYVRHLFDSVYKEQVGDWFDSDSQKGEDHLSLENIVIGRLAEAKHSNVLNKIRKIYDDDTSGRKDAPKHLKETIYQAKVAEMTDLELKKEVKKYIKTKDPEEKNKIEARMTNVRQEEQIKAIIKLSFSKHVRSQDSLSFLMGIEESSLKGRILVWQFFKQNVQVFKEKFGSSGSGMLNGLIKSFFKDFASKKTIENIKTFMQGVQQDFPGISQAINQGYEKAMINHDVMVREGFNIERYLREFHKLIQ